MSTMTATEVRELRERVLAGYMPTTDEMLAALDCRSMELERRLAVLKGAV